MSITIPFLDSSSNSRAEISSKLGAFLDFSLSIFPATSTGGGGGIARQVGQIGLD